ncbi:MAG TPA: hypothetical protein DDX04_10940, partial [Massilia sp.]|nr:hypothetical protein [Massilia sp.]
KRVVSSFKMNSDGPSGTIDLLCAILAGQAEPGCARTNNSKQDLPVEDTARAHRGVLFER